jgi:hypothetical protein
MDHYCKYNGIPLSAHFMYLNSGYILAWWWLENSRNMSPCYQLIIVILWHICCVYRRTSILPYWHNTTGWLLLNSIKLYYILVRKYKDIKIPTAVWQLITFCLNSSRWMTVLMTWLWIGQGRFLRIRSHKVIHARCFSKFISGHMTSTDFAAVTDVVILFRRPELK